MSAMIDRVAIAIAKAFPGGMTRYVVGSDELVPCTWEEWDPVSREVYRRRARAAIDAMRHPDMVMIEAGHIAHPNHYGPGAVMCVVHYRTMIDEALK